MAEVKRLVCDLCDGEEDVSSVTVTSRTTGKPQNWELDLCESCFGKRLRDLQAKGHSPRKRPGRPPSRGKETHISTDNL